MTAALKRFIRLLTLAPMRAPRSASARSIFAGVMTTLSLGLSGNLVAAPAVAVSTPPAASQPGAAKPAAAGPALVRARPPAGPPPEIMPVSEIRAGMVGEAYTVFSGTKPEMFKVRVVSVVNNFLPKQDVILV